jgi:hypothetical protein
MEYRLGTSGVEEESDRSCWIHLGGNGRFPLAIGDEAIGRIGDRWMWSVEPENSFDLAMGDAATFEVWGYVSPERCTSALAWVEVA